MKKRYYLIALVLVAALCSFTYSNKEGRDIPTDGEQIRTLYYRGHSYICYRFFYQGSRRVPVDGYNNYSGAGIIHDPDCKCHKKGEKIK